MSVKFLLFEVQLSKSNKRNKANENKAFSLGIMKEKDCNELLLEEYLFVQFEEKLKNMTYYFLSW